MPGNLKIFLQLGGCKLSRQWSRGLSGSREQQCQGNCAREERSKEYLFHFDLLQEAPGFPSFPTTEAQIFVHDDSLFLPHWFGWRFYPFGFERCSESGPH
jgi:hypothetical protein